LQARTKFNNFFRSAFTVDNVIFGFDEGKLKVLLIRRNEDPYNNYWALPGYFVREDEALNEAANRVLLEVTGLKNVYLEQVRTFGTPGRHDFGRVITVAYYSLIKIADFSPRAAGVAQDITWHPVENIAELAFDHENILRTALDRLKRSIRVRPVGFELLPPAFTLTELQHLYEAIWETDLRGSPPRQTLQFRRRAVPGTGRQGFLLRDQRAQEERGTVPLLILSPHDRHPPAAPT